MGQTAPRPARTVKPHRDPKRIRSLATSAMKPGNRHRATSTRGSSTGTSHPRTLRTGHIAKVQISQAHDSGFSGPEGWLSQKAGGCQRPSWLWPLPHDGVPQPPRHSGPARQGSALTGQSWMATSCRCKNYQGTSQEENTCPVAAPSTPSTNCRPQGPTPQALSFRSSRRGLGICISTSFPTESQPRGQGNSETPEAPRI